MSHFIKKKITNPCFYHLFVCFSLKLNVKYMVNHRRNNKNGNIVSFEFNILKIIFHNQHYIAMYTIKNIIQLFFPRKAL